jgi:RND superfamily putative drug exporter
MFLVFASFIITSDPTIKQFGVGLATAVLLAGIMVVLLVPAMLTLFGRLLFALPRPLDRIVPHIDVEGTGTGTPVRIPDSPSVPSDRSPATAERGVAAGGHDHGARATRPESPPDP